MLIFFQMSVLQKDIQLIVGIFHFGLNEGSPPPSPGQPLTVEPKLLQQEII